jgi:hypothetical protein
MTLFTHIKDQTIIKKEEGKPLGSFCKLILHEYEKAMPLEIILFSIVVHS